MANINSYAENLNALTQSTKEVINIATALNEAVTGNEAQVVVTEDKVMPSFENIIKRVERAENTVSKFVNGKGVVETNDGTYRKIKVDSVSKPAVTITNLTPIDNFDINANWFFESLQYPRCIVTIDLKGQIDDDSDRAYVNRVIIPANQETISDDVGTTILDGNLEYGALVDYLDSMSVAYKEDRDEVKLPLTYEKFKGTFQITSISVIKNMSTGLNEKWYYLSTVNYSSINEDGIVTDSGHVLNVGDYLRFNNSLFKIKEVNQTEKRVKLEYNLGYEAVNVYDSFELYNAPFNEKIISVGIGIDEYDVVYVKGVNENFNVLSRDWSNPIAFYTNELIFANDPNKRFDEFYVNNVADFGKRLIAQFKEGHMPAYGSKTPNAPTLNESDLRVVQINTQLEATLDSERYTNITSDIASIKSNITAVRNTISSNKDKLVQESDTYSRETIQNTINSETDKMNNLTTQFSSLVEELNTLLNNAGAINYSPKYHIRGFFAIPDPQYVIPSSKIGKQSIIGFETMYRYLHTNETGTRLNTFNYTDTSTGITSTAVFSDWNLSVSSFLEKHYDSATDSYVWSDERIDGSKISINQIDIPIRSGEKVELKVRSISEAGYPYTPVKSEWSNSVIMSFPENFTTNDSVTTILETVKSDMTSVVLQETMSAAGVYTHLADGNSKFKHNANNIEYVETSTDSSGNTVVTSMSVADKLKAIIETVNTQISGINTDSNSPSVEYEIGSGTDKFTGRILLRTPALEKAERREANNKLLKFVDSSIYPYIVSKLV